MKKLKIISFIIAVLFLLPLVPVHSDDAFWVVRDEYLKAVETGDSQKIISAVKMVEALYPDPQTEEERSRIMFMIKQAANQYEKLGLFTEAAEYYQKFLDLCRASVNAGFHTYSGYLKTIPFIVAHNSVKPTVYAVTSSTSNIPYYKAKNEPKAGTYVGMCDTYNVNRDSAFLLYVLFGSEDISSYGWMIPEDPDLVLEVAWNMPNETLDDLKKVNSGAQDKYIERNLDYLNSLNCKVLIRFAAEVNCWPSLPATEDGYNTTGQEFINEFKAAFRKVSTLAKRIAPNAAMVYSPNEVSGWMFDHTDFYPGDEYVDWVGMSTYGNYRAGTNTLSDENDAFYCRGMYENQITKIKSIVDAYGSRKPIMISEMGFSYSGPDGTQTVSHAKTAMKFFVTYVNMVYPQIKVINYFNTNYGAEKYRIFNNTILPSSTNQDANSELGSLYASLVKNNPAAQYLLGNGKKCGYTEITNINEVTDSLDLSVYAWYPTKEPITVEYSLDTAARHKTSNYPYSYSLKTKTLTRGDHLLSVSVSCMNEQHTYQYLVTCGKDGKVSVKDASIDNVTDVSLTDWYYGYVAYCMKTGILAGVGGNQFAPSVALNRAMFVTILGRLSGVDTSKYNYSSFDDVPTGEWYTPYVAWAKENGIVNGMSKNSFSPLGMITREQMCAILIRFADKFDVKLSTGGGNAKFADDADISDWAKDSVYRARAAGIVNGKGGNRFAPKDNTTRAEGAAIFMRYKLIVMGS